MRKINEVRHELKIWGNYWYHMEKGQGYSNKSNIELLRETLRLGKAITGTGHLVSHLADNIKVPDHIAGIDLIVNQLQTHHRVAIRQFYINGRKIRSRLLNEAERELL